MKRFNILLILAAMSLPNMTKAQSSLYENEFPLSDVKLLDSPFKSAMDLNVNVLLSYDVDRLLAPFFIEAGLEPKGELF
ncbi:MAG: glycoside hydrolase family 127 protein, partial [Duncaniella sp.]|nr:glycoside hydrolase family 127 protein [Duncaniella sp.]